MFSPRTLIIAGIVLIAVALGPSGHGLWWLVGFVWLLPHSRRNGWVGCHGSARHGRRDGRHRADDVANGPDPSRDADPADPTAAQPDPTHDRHEAFPTR